MKVKDVFLVFLLWFACLSLSHATTNTEQNMCVENNMLIRKYINYGEIKATADIESENSKNRCTFTADQLSSHLSLYNRQVVANLLWYRWFYRKFANITEVVGNTFFYCGSGLSTIAAVSTVICPDALKYFLFSSVACNTANLALLGVANFSSTQVQKQELEINKIANKVGFCVISLTPQIVNENK